MTNWPSDPRGCGRGLLDNVRGRTSGAEGANWICTKDGINEVATFQISSIYRDAGNRVQDAIYLASQDNHLSRECKRGRGRYVASLDGLP